MPLHGCSLLTIIIIIAVIVVIIIIIIIIITLNAVTAADDATPNVAFAAGIPVVGASAAMRVWMVEDKGSP